MDWGGKPYRLNEEAKLDLAIIYWRGFDEFGEAQANKYLAALMKRMDEINTSPVKYPEVRHIREGYRRSVCGVDSIYYRLIDDSVEIMRVLGRQDFEVDAMLGSGIRGKGFLHKAVRWCEHFALNRSDFVSTISRSMMEKVESKGVERDKLLFFPNWSELERFQSVQQGHIELIRQRFGLAENRKVCLYSGKYRRQARSGDISRCRQGIFRRRG